MLIDTRQNQLSIQLQKRSNIDYYLSWLHSSQLLDNNKMFSLFIEQSSKNFKIPKTLKIVIKWNFYPEQFPDKCLVSSWQNRIT